MAVGNSLSVNIVGLAKFRSLLDRVAKGMGARSQLHQRYGIQAMNWVQRNFRSEGSLSGAPWKKLSPNTIIGRRQRGKGAKILRDTGQLANSFTMTFDANEAAVGTDKKYAPFHEHGGTRSYAIRPKRGKSLAFAHVAGRPLKKAMMISERKHAKGTPIMFSKGVIHPPLPKRKMLPTAANIMPQLVRTTINFLNELKRQGRTLG